MEKYLEAGEYIDWRHPSIVEKAAELARGYSSEEETVKRLFEFVRDAVRHSWDHQLNPVTCRASEVLFHGTGFCYAKSHLLAALLRARGIPAGLCYQRLAQETEARPYCLHGLNAVYLQRYGWYRIDARGNKPGMTAEFRPPEESLAFQAVRAGERDLPEIWPEPLPCVVRALTGSRTIEELYHNLPDVEVTPG
jgi:transglutaminase-like putative cysteine protease